MITEIGEKIINETLEKARNSSRKRAVHCFHQPGETLQRMLNAGTKDTYVCPHKHENPDKLEIFNVLRGDLAVFRFNNYGRVEQTVLLEEKGPVRSVEILPRIWHGLVFLSPEAVIYELIEGPYNPSTHKNFAPWAPSEDSPQSKRYLEELRRSVKY